MVIVLSADFVMYSFANRPVRVFTPSCENIWQLQKEQFTDQNGLQNVRVCGKFNLFDFVQSSRQAVDIEHLLDRFTNGDYKALNSRPATYGDVADMPKSIHQAYKTFLKAQDVWNSLDPDVRSYYGNDIEVFLNRYEGDLAAASQRVAEEGDQSET